MTLILAILTLFGLIKAVETMSSFTAAAGCCNYTYSTPKGFRAYRPGLRYFINSRIHELKPNWTLLLAIASVLLAYHLASLDEAKGCLIAMTLLNTNDKPNPHMEKLKHMWKTALQKSRLNFEKVVLTKNPMFVHKYRNILVLQKTWDFQDSCIRSVETYMDELSSNYFTDRFQGEIWYLPGLWKMKFKMREAFLNTLYAQIKASGNLFHMSEKTSECYFYVGSKEQFIDVIGELPKASKFKKTVAAIASVVERYTVTGLPETLKIVMIDAVACGYRKHVGDGMGGLFFNLEYQEGRTGHDVGATQCRIIGNPGDIAKVCMSWGTNSALVWEDILANMDGSLPTLDGFIFMENIKGGFRDVKHGDILSIKANDIITLKKARAPGENNSLLGGQLQIATVTQPLEWKEKLLAKSPVHHEISLMKEVWNSGSLDAMWELGFNRGDDIERILSRLLFDGLRDQRTMEVHKTSVYRKFLDRVRKAEHHDQSWSAYAVGLIQLGLAEQWHFDRHGQVKHFALTPSGCDVESLAVRYPATSNHSCVAITPIQQLKTHDVVMIAASTKEWLSWNECGFGDWDGDMFSIYRGLTEGFVNHYPQLTEIPTDVMSEPTHYIDGIIGASDSAVIAKASISESDRAVRFGFMLLFVNMFEGRVKLSVDMLAKLVQDTASMRETFIKSSKRTEVCGKQASIETKILSMFPQATTSELGKEAAALLFNMTTSDAGIGGDKHEWNKLDAIVDAARAFKSPKYAAYQGILKRFPFINNISKMSDFNKLDYAKLDEMTLNSMCQRGMGLIKKFRTDDMNVPHMRKVINRLGWLVNHFNTCIKAKDLSTLFIDNPLFKDVKELPSNEDRWIIQAEGVRKFMEKTIANSTLEEVMVYIGMLMSGWDNSRVDKFEGFGCYTTPSGYEFRRRGFIFWMLPKHMMAKAAFALATRDAMGEINNPFLKNAQTPDAVESLLHNYVEEDDYVVEDGVDLDDQCSDDDFCLNYI